jgi:hypothetical protein
MLFFCCAESVTTLGSGSLFSHLLSETAHAYAIGIPSALRMT